MTGGSVAKGEGPPTWLERKSVSKFRAWRVLGPGLALVVLSLSMFVRLLFDGRFEVPLLVIAGVGGLLSGYGWRELRRAERVAAWDREHPGEASAEPTPAELAEAQRRMRGFILFLSLLGLAVLVAALFTGDRDDLVGAGVALECVALLFGGLYWFQHRQNR